LFAVFELVDSTRFVRWFAPLEEQQNYFENVIRLGEFAVKLRNTPKNCTSLTEKKAF